MLCETVLWDSLYDRISINEENTNLFINGIYRRLMIMRSNQLKRRKVIPVYNVKIGKKVIGESVFN